MKQQFFQSISRVFPDGRPTVEVGALGTSPFRHLLLFLAFILLPMLGWAQDATAALDAVKASGTGSYYELDLVPTIKDTAYVGYNSTGSGTGSTITTSHWKLSSSRTINFKVKNCSKIEIYAEFVKDKTTSVKYKIGSGTATEFMTNGTSKKCVRTASFNTGTSNEIIVTISSDQDFLLGTAKFYPIALTKHSVTYSAGDGSGTVPTHADVAENDTFHVASAAGLTAPDGQEFKCWNDDTNDYNPGATYTMGKSDVTLTAQWQNITQKYTLTFAAGEGGTGTMEAKEYAEGVVVTLPACTFTAPTGKAFDKWTVEGVSGVTELADGGSFTMPANDVNLTATYKKAPTVLFSMEVASGATSKSVSAGTTIALSSNEATITGGTVNFKNNNTSAKNVGSTQSSTVYFMLEKTGSYYEVNLNAPNGLDVGDTIISSVYGGKNERGIFFTTSGTVTTVTDYFVKTGSGASSDSEQKNLKYVVKEGDDLVGAKTFYIERYTGNGTYFKTFRIIRPAAKDTVKTEVDLKDVKANGTSIPAAKFSSLKSEGVVTLDGTFTSAPEITFVERTTITFDDQSKKVTTKDVVKQAESAVGGYYTVNATIADTAYTVNAQAVAAVKAAFYDGTKKLGVLNVQYNTAPVAAQYAAFEVKPLSTFDKWYSDPELQTPANMSTPITDSTTYFGKWTTAYAQSIDMEKFVIENTKKGDYATFIANKNWQLSNAKELDSLNSTKPKNNAPYLGLKFNSASGEVLGNIKAGKLVTIKTGNMPANGARIVLAEAKDTVKLTSYSDSLPKVSYMYTENADVLKFQTLTGSTTMLKAILVTDPYVVTYTNGGTIDPMTFKGTPLTLPNATGTGEFQGWFDAETGGTKVGMNGDSYTPTASIELFAQFSALSTNNEIVSFTFADSTVTATEGKRDYTINLPYKGIVPDTLTYIVAEEHATSGQVTKNGNVLSFTVTAQNGAPANYTVTFTVAPKDPLCIVKTATTGSKTQTLSGLYADMDATNMVNLGSDMKLGGKSNYIGVQMVSTQKFKEGDIINVHTTAAAQQGNIAIYSNTGESATKIADLSTGFGVLGDNKFALPAGVESYNTLYICRTSANSWNGYVDFVEVTRPMNPVLTKATLCDKVATIDESAKTVTVEVPFSTDITAVTPAFEYVSNDNSKVVITPAGAQDFSEEAKTYRFTDKDGDYTEYEVSITKAAASSDATLKSLSVEGYTLDPAFAAETLSYTIERAYKDKDAELPAITYEVNYSAATAVKTTEGKVVTITVTAEDGTTQKAYTITFTNKAASTDATLKSLMYGDKAITLVADQYTYNVNLPYGTTEVPALTAVKNDELASDPVINNATAFVDFQATSTATVTAESGDEQVYTVNFTVAEFPSVVIFDGSTMSAMATSPDASGLSWAEVGTTMSQADKSATYQGVSYTKSLQLGNTSATKHFTITVPENKMAKIHLLTMTNSNTSTRSAWITTSADKGDKEDAIMSVTSSSYTDLGDGTTDWLADNTTYYIHTDNTVNFFVISVELKPIAPKCEAPVISAQPESNTQFGAGDMTASVTASVTDGGTLSYQWYEIEGGEVAGATAATLTTTAEGSYYVIITNTLADHRDNSVISDTAKLGYRKLDDATLSALGYGETAITLVDAQYTYEVELAKGTTEVPALSATTSSSYATKVITNAAAFVDYKATSTVVVTAEDGTTSLTYTVNFTVRHDLEQVSVSETTVWNWTNAASQSIKLTDLKNVEVLMANIAGVNNDANFNSQALIFYGENVKNTEGGVNYASIGHIKFTTTIPGLVTVEFADNGSNNRRLMINDAVSESSASKTDYKTFSAPVNAGEVTLMGVKPDKTGTNQYIRIRKITFTASEVVRSGLTSGKVVTYCNSKQVTAFWGAKFYYISDKASDLSSIELTEVDTLAAGYPYIVIAEDSEVRVVYGTEEQTTAQTYNGLHGVLGATVTLVDGDYLIKNNKYYRAHTGNNNTIADGRAFLRLSEIEPTDVAPGKEQPAPSPRRIRLGSAEAQTATGVDAILMDAEGVQKMVIDNQVVIIRNGRMFNAQGALLR